MAKFKCFGNRSDKATILEEKNRNLAKKIASEGIVLLKNEGVLPLKNKKVALYGNGARMTIKGGTGSGDVRERYSVNIENGLKNLGCKILTNTWLDRFDNDFNKKQNEFKERIENEIKKFNVFQTMKMFIYIGEQHLDYPLAFKIEEEELIKDTDTCIYVISRQAGEGKDREIKKGDFLLTDDEIYNINLCAKTYKNFVLLINSGSSLDITDIALNENVKAIMYVSLGGEEGGNAIADALYGNITPSGKLSFTWGKRYEDYPSFDHFSYLREDKSFDEYKEGLFVGYKHFNAKNIKPLYPFGYGLSYADFQIEYSSIQSENSLVNIHFNVKNNSKEYSGKEVVQIYLRKPINKLINPKYELVAFEKTKLLSPGEDEQIVLNFDLKDFAIYDEEAGEYKLEGGEYSLYYGNSSQNLNYIAKITLEKTLIVKKVKNLKTETKIIEDIYNFDLKEQSNVNVDNVFITKITPEINEDGAIEQGKYTKLIKKLSDKDLCKLVFGGGYGGKYFNRVPGSCGRTTSDLVKKGIPNLTLCDGPAGLNLIQKIAYTKNGGTRYIDELPKDWQWGWIKKYGKFFITKSKKVTRVYNFCTAFPCETMLACTFNKDLAFEEGKAIAEEMEVFGLCYWLAPGVNIQRNPLCGRNFEYYSEDSLVSAVFGAYVTKGVQTTKGGYGVTIKHFCCNNEENYRTKVDVKINERALREVYLRVYERIIKWANPKSIMASYNQVDGTYVVNSKKLLKDYLRDELHYSGLVMSDWNATDSCSHFEALKNGNNLIMPGNKKLIKSIYKGLKEGKITRGVLIENAYYVLDAIFNSEINKNFKEDL